MVDSYYKEDSVDSIGKKWNSVDKSVMHQSNSIFLRLQKLAYEVGIFHAKIVKEYGITFSDYDLLVTLFKQGEPYSLLPTQLFKEVLVTSGTMTYQINKLSKQKLIKRCKNPLDKRSVFIKLTPLGLEKVKSMYKVLPKERLDFLSNISLKNQKILNNLLREILIKFESKSGDN